MQQTKITGFYDQKLNVYQWDEEMTLGKHKSYISYIQQFAKRQKGKGLDAGTGPLGPMGKFFTQCSELHGFDVTETVVKSLPEIYTKKFVYDLSSGTKLPYDDNQLDFILCASVIQHLTGWGQVIKAVKEFSRVLKPGGEFFFMFKAGTNDSIFTHVNKHYKEQRSFRVFEPTDIQKLCQENGFDVKEKQFCIGENWIGYCQFLFIKK